MNNTRVVSICDLSHGIKEMTTELRRAKTHHKDTKDTINEVELRKITIGMWAGLGPALTIFVYFFLEPGGNSLNIFSQAF
jgi:hypothetical protein